MIANTLAVILEKFWKIEKMPQDLILVFDVGKKGIPTIYYVLVQPLFIAGRILQPDFQGHRW